jgi:hypothetical protein
MNAVVPSFGSQRPSTTVRNCGELSSPDVASCGKLRGDLLREAFASSSQVFSVIGVIVPYIRG